MPWTYFTSYYPRETLDLLTSAHERCIKCVLTIDCQVYARQNCLAHQEIIDDVLILTMLEQKLPFLGLLFFEKCNSYQEHPLSSPREGKVVFAFCALLIIQLFFMSGKNPSPSVYWLPHAKYFIPCLIRLCTIFSCVITCEGLLRFFHWVF